MFNLKLSVIASVMAFFLSLLIGLISRSSFPILLLRPVFFGILFFALTTLITLLVNRFLPELLEQPEAPELNIPGAHIDIKENSSVLPDDLPQDLQPEMSAVPPAFSSAMPDIPSAMPTYKKPAGQGGNFARPDDSEDDLGNISDAGTGPVTTPPASAVEPVVPEDSESAFNSFTPDKTSVSVKPVKPDAAGMDQPVKNGYNGLGNLSVSNGGEGIDILPDLESLAGAFLPSGRKEEEVQEYQSVETPRKSVSGNKPQKMDSDFHPKELAAGIRTIIKEQEG